MRALAMLAVVAACSSDPPPAPTTTTLAGYLQRVAAADPATRAREVASWKLDRATWDRTVIATYRDQYVDYTRVFDAVATAFVTQLARGDEITTRAHYAGDPKLTLGEARARWALPVQYPSEVAEIGGVPIDAVFVRDGRTWRAIVGVDHIVRARVDALDPACGVHVAEVRTGRCGDVAWAIADAALRADTRQFRHACLLANSLCAR